MKYYDEKDFYSDGDIEIELLEMLRTRDIDSILRNDKRWPVFYHCTDIRKNLLEWYPFKRGDVLEIGSGCGAVTGVLAEHNNSVTCVEISKIRAMIAEKRNSIHDNIEIFVGNLNNIVLDRRFDYITLIGVLEYAGRFTETKQPYLDFLKKARSFLKEDGNLILAIENKFGMKYWAGACEDHTGLIFDGIEGYKSNVMKTFGKIELINMLHQAGFGKLKFYYPYPDYKIPHVIYSDEYLPRCNELFEYSPDFYKEGLRLFNEARVFNEIIKNDSFPFFSNSFLIFAKTE